MERLLRMVSLGLLFVMAGCIPSVHPLYTEQDLIFDPALVGEWVGVDKDDQETWTFTKTGEKEYKLTYVDNKGKKGEFVVHLLQAEGRRFLDFFPASLDLKENDFYQAHILPVHTFMRVLQIEPALQMVMLQPDWIKKFLQENPDAVRHEKLDDSILLTAPPKELQAFLIKHEKTPDAWGEPSSLTRRAKNRRQ